MPRNELMKGEVAGQKTKGRCQVLAGLGGGQTVRLYQCSTMAQVEAVVDFIRDLRAYPDEAETFIRWLQLTAKTKPARTIPDLPDVFSDNGAEAPKEEASHD